MYAEIYNVLIRYFNNYLTLHRSDLARAVLVNERETIIKKLIISVLSNFFLYQTNKKRYKQNLNNNTKKDTTHLTLTLQIIYSST